MIRLASGPLVCLYQSSVSGETVDTVSNEELSSLVGIFELVIVVRHESILSTDFVRWRYRLGLHVSLHFAEGLNPDITHEVCLFSRDIETTFTTVLVEHPSAHPSRQQSVTLRTFYSAAQRLYLYTLLSISFQLVQLSRPRVD